MARKTAARLIDGRLDRLALQHGYAHLHHGNPRIALDTYRELLARRPLDPQLWFHFGRALIKARSAAFSCRQAAE